MPKKPLLSPQACIQKAGLTGTWQMEPIANGLSHDHYLLRQGQDKLVLRIYSQQHLPWLDAEHELRVLDVAANTGLAPDIVFCPPEMDFFISRYVDHQPVSQLNLTQLQELLRAVARLPIHKVMSMSERYQMYLQHAIRHEPERLDSAPLMALRARTEQVLAELESHTWAPVPSFLDWHEQNILATPDQIYLIDYEYACLTALPLELASLYESGLANPDDWPQLQQWIEMQQGQRVSERQLRLGRYIYLSLCFLWYLAHQVDEPYEIQLLEQRLQVLEQQLF